MASEELQGGDLHNQAPPPAPIPLPPYPEMILAAIEALNEENGSNKSSISKHIAKHIEATYGPIPPAHSALLNHHLNKMKSSGQLQFLKNNYLVPDPNAPPRRGRGRPPKPKAALPAGAPVLPPRPRGRPPKSHDPTAPPPPPKSAITAPSLSGRKRGRPPKAAAAGGAAAVDEAVAPNPPPAAGGAPPRGRGRPPKVKPVVTASLGA
ncbi:HMG-Y-related protein A-like [Salvia miltiorrhiza]|uniref:HMG-Y-related protein A-like n=1 Tax=Salvia miltiorrhiza TaxID=226208 RepID=UPI0025ACE800|nr:HMG-Y-related protein A-like [Salvia miltiorrhiza]